jgi:DNA mismatch endonuclease (patch repair protein)
MDRLSSIQRSALMAKIRSGDTKPEISVRRVAHSLGLRFRLHRRDLPGTPDLVFPRFKTVVFVHGCFWHQHAGCRRASLPKTRVDFWRSKLKGNVARDKTATAALKGAGWRVIVIWECETKSEARLFRFLQKKFGLRTKRKAVARRKAYREGRPPKVVGDR